jgi:hypothetical protein
MSHGWLKVEEGENERALPSKKKRERKSKKASPPLKRTLLSLLSDKGSRLH